jgi:hypothetical protein
MRIINSKIVWEGKTKRVKSPYAKFIMALLILYLSTARHEKPCRNLGRPLSKAKYSTATDSA